MPTTPQLRDDETTKAILAGWLTARHPTGARVEVVDLRRPQGSGASNETLLVQTVTPGEEAAPTRLVLRIAPTKVDVVMEPRFAEQYRVIETLGRHTDVPVPRMLGYEADTSYFGAPFWIMSHVEGRALADFPPYNQEGWFFAAPPEERRRIWRSGVEALAGLARVPLEPFGFLDDPARGEGGLRQHLQYWREFLDWASDPFGDPVLEKVYDWLVAHFPDDPIPGLTWGDSRIGNLLFDGGKCTAVLDWELVSLGGPIIDLAYWLICDEMWSAGLGLEPLEGLGTREETIALWQECSGITVPDLTWYDVLGWFRMACVMLRNVHLCREIGRTPPGPGELGYLGDVTVRLARQLHLSGKS